jgi:3-isopropylmalate dehydrogenase
VLLGAVGGPKWDTTDPDAPRPEQGLLGLRKGLGLYANLRPVRPSPALVDASPLRPDRISGTDLLVVRELTGGIYFGESGRDGDRAHDDCSLVAEIERSPMSLSSARGAAGRRRARVTSVDKANVLETSRLWHETVERVAREYGDVELDHMLVDNAAMQLVANPARFDVILTDTCSATSSATSRPCSPARSGCCCRRALRRRAGPVRAGSRIGPDIAGTVPLIRSRPSSRSR